MSVKHALKALGLSLMAALSLLTFMASGAQAETYRARREKSKS